MVSILKRIWNRVAGEPAVTLGVAVAAINTSADHSWLGYAAAVAVALVRFAVTPVLPKFDA